MKKYYFVAESGADLTPALIQKYDIRVAAMHVALGQTDYLDGEISVDDTCAYYDKTGRLPKTSAVSPHQYSAVFDSIRKENPEAIIMHVGYSDVLTSSFHNAVIASEGYENIYHVDSANVSLGQGFIVVKAAQFVEENPDISPEELVKVISGFAKKTHFWFIPGSLKYLRAGGRVSNIKSVIASLLHIKPLLQVIDGKLVASKNYRGPMNRVVLAMINDLFANALIELETVFIGYTHKIENDLREAMDKLVKSFGVKNLLWFKAGAVITTHAGPGGVGIAVISK